MDVYVVVQFDASQPTCILVPNIFLLMERANLMLAGINLIDKSDFTLRFCIEFFSLLAFNRIRFSLKFNREIDRAEIKR